MHAAAERVVAEAERALGVRGRFHWALAGGSTPAELYSLLASARYARQVDWARVHFFFGDERCVPPEHEQSNYRMASEALLAPLGVPPERVHRVLGELPAPEAAARYEAELRRCIPASAGGFPELDLILLGMGADGHTASLFPGGPALAERERWVVESTPSGLAARVTLTLPVLDAARCVLFLVAGHDKAAAVRDVLAVPAVPPRPAGLVRPRSGPAEWLLDAGAAAALGGAS